MSTLRPEMLGILREMRALLADERAWIKEHYAMTADGDITFGADPAACKWCLTGAFDRAKERRPDALVSLRDLGWALAEYREKHDIPYTCGPMDFNDSNDTTHQDVLAFLDWAIAESVRTARNPHCMGPVVLAAREAAK